MHFDAKAYHEIYHADDTPATTPSMVTGEIKKPKAVETETKETPVDVQPEKEEIDDAPEVTETEKTETPEEPAKEE